MDVCADPHVGHIGSVMVSPENLDQAISELRQMNIEFSMMIQNVQILVELQTQQTSLPTADVKTGHPMTWTEYHTQDDMEAYMDYLTETYSDMVSTEEIGASYEGRPMRVLQVCKSGKCGGKSIMRIDSGIHAREWIGPATVIFHMKELIENSS